MNQFCGMKGIKREFSVAKTPQQNGVAKRKNKTLIEAARTMLADSFSPTTFWAEAVNTACYVQNWVLVTKPHNKTPYELLHGRPPCISFMRPFGCPVTILNILDPLGKFDGKADEGFLVGYSINSKAFRVFNTRTRKVEENLHITFLENKPNVAGSGPDWLFDIDLLTNSMNYNPVTARNQTNVNAEDAVANDAGKKTTKEPANEGERNGQEKERGASNKKGDQNVQDLRDKLDKLLVQQKEAYANSTNRVSTVSPSVSVVGQSFINGDDLPTDPFMPNLEDTTDLLNTGIFSGAYDDEDVGEEADLNNLETTMNVNPIPTTKIHKDHPKDQIIRDINLATQIKRMTKSSQEPVIFKPKKVTQALTDLSWIEAMQDELLQFRLQKDLRAKLDKLLVQQKEGYANSTNRDSTVSPSVSAVGQSFTNANDLPTDPLMPDLEDATDLLNTGIFSGAYDNEDVGAEADLNNLETTMNVSPIPTTRIHKDHPKEQIIGNLLSAPQTRRITKSAQEHAMVYKNKKDERGIIVRNKARLVAQGYTQEKGIDYDEVFAPVARIEAIRLFLAYASFMGFIMYQMDVKSAFLYGTIEEEVYVYQPPGFEDPQFPNKVYKVYVDDVIFGSTKKSLCVEFEQMMHKRFQISSIGELTFFLGLQVKQKDDGIFISQDKYVADILKKFDFVIVKTTSTLIETNKALLKDEEAGDVYVHLYSVDVHLYRSMIGSLMYLTASRPDIMFAVCACARFQVTPKVLHLHAMKSDYAGASLNRKSTIGGVVDLKSNA
ncbi:putative ribonuclease H-like domain-containing protein [Tanacetum coccineum]